MKIENIQEKWNKDSIIDISDLASESIKTPQLHSEYYKIYINERLVFRKLEFDLKKLKFDKYEFFTNGPDETNRDKGWLMPAKGRIMKADISHYLESDNDIINLSLRIGIQQEKINFLDSIIKNINTRGFQIKNSIEYLRFQNGLN